MLVQKRTALKLRTAEQGHLSPTDPGLIFLQIFPLQFEETQCGQDALDLTPTSWTLQFLSLPSYYFCKIKASQMAVTSSQLVYRLQDNQIRNPLSRYLK